MNTDEWQDKKRQLQEKPEMEEETHTHTWTNHIKSKGKTNKIDVCMYVVSCLYTRHTYLCMGPG